MLRRSLYVLGLWLTLGVTLSAQRTLRYWFDDQYEAQRTLPSTASVGQLSKYDIPTADLSAGLHTLYLQIRGADGLLSPVRSSLFLKAKAPLSSASGREKLHYWIDDIASKGKPISIAPDSEGIVDMDLPLGSVPTGLHTLYLQWEDEGGYVSPVRSFLFVKPHILPSSTGKPTIHYWYDDIRSKHYKLPPLSQESGVFDLTLSTADLKAGLHTLYLQYQAKGGEVAHVRSAIFVKHNTQAGYDKRRLRYWFDDLHATPRLVELPHTESHGYAVGLPTDKLSYGLHTLYMQYEGAGGSPSPVRSALFLKAPSLSDGAGIKSIRYWFDDQTEATRHYDFEHPLVAGSELTLDLDATGLMRGEHTLHAVLVDENGISGDVQSLKFVEERGIPSEVYLRRLSPDPNELVPSKLMEGAIIRFYYRIEDADKKPVAGVKLKVSFAGEEFVSDPSDTEGVVMVEIETSKKRKDGQKLLSLGKAGTLKFLALNADKQVLTAKENEFSSQSYSVAYPLYPSTFEMKLSSGAGVGQGRFKLDVLPGGSVALDFNENGDIKSVKSGSYTLGKGKVDISFAKQWPLGFSLGLMRHEAVWGKPTPGNALAVIDRLGRGLVITSVFTTAYAHAINRWLSTNGQNAAAFTKEASGWRGSASLSVQKDTFDELSKGLPFSDGHWKKSIHIGNELDFSGRFGVDFQLPNWGYVGSSSEELKVYRQPNPKLSLKFSDLGMSYSKRLLEKGMRVLYDGSQNIFQTLDKDIYGSFKGNFGLGVSYDHVESPYLNTPTKLKTSYNLEGKLSYGFPVHLINQLPISVKSFDMSLTAELGWEFESSGTMLSLMWGDKESRHKVLPSWEDKVHVINPSVHYEMFAERQKSMKSIWSKLRSSQATPWVQSAADLQEGYKFSRSLQIGGEIQVDIPLKWLTWKFLDAELGVSYNLGDSYYHIQAGREVLPVSYSILDVIKNPLLIGEHIVSGLSKVVNYLNTSNDDFDGGISGFLHSGWVSGKEGVKNGWRTIKSWGRQISDVLRGADEFRAMTFADKTELEISYPLDGHVFSSDSQVQLLSLFGGRQVVDRTTAGEELLVIGDIFYIEALDGTTKLKTSKAPFTLHASVGKDDLRFYSLSEDTPLGLYYVLDDEKGGLELVGEVGKDIKETRLGHYVIACKKPNDAVAPVIKATVDWSKGMLSVDIQDASGVDGHRTVVSIDGEPMKLDGQMQSRIRIPLSTDKLKQNSIFVYVYASDLSGNTSTYLEELANSNPSSAKVSVSRLEAKLYPTQTRTVLWLETPAEFLGCPVRIYDASGATHRELVVRETTTKLDVSDLPAGNYWLRVGAETHRFVKQE